MATVRLQLRRGTASQWTSANPILAAGELGVESDTNLFKFGNGSTTWTALAYANNSDVAIGEISQDAINNALSMGAGLSKTYDDGANTITITVDSTIATKTYADDAVTAHQNDTTSVHGITNTEDIVYLTGAQTLSGKTLSNVVLSGTPTAPTQAANDNSTKIATTEYVQTELADLIGTAPALLDTLGELSDALNDNENYAAAMTSTITGINNSLATKLPTTDFTAHLTDTTDVHGISDTANLVYTSDSRLSDNRTPVNGSVVAASMATDSITTQSITDAAVTGQKIADDAVTAAKIAASAVGTSEIADDAVTADKIATGSVGSSEIASNAVGSDHIAASAVGTSEIADDAVTADKIAASAVGTSEIADYAVTATKIATGSVGSSEIASNAVGSDHIAASAVGTSEIADLNITTAKINDSAVTEGKIAGLAVTEGKIADGSVSTVKIADSAVTSGKIANGTIVDADINATAAIAITKIDGLGTSLDSKLASSTAASTYAPIASPTFTGTVSGVTKSHVGLGNVDNTADADKPVSTATQTALDLKSPLASPTFTGTVTTGHVLPATDITFDLGSPTKMWRDIYVGPGSLYVNGQKVLQTDAGDVVITADANENLALRTSGSGNIELDPTGAGTVSIKGPMVIEASANITSADGNGINFGSTVNVDAITSKTLNTDLSLSGNGTGKVYLNDNAEVNGNLVVGGNLTVSGTTTTVNSETISLADNIIDLNSNFTTGTPTENAGIKIKRGDSSDVQIRWNESTDKWEFTNDGTNYYSVAGLESPTFTGTVSGVTKTMVGLGNVDNTADTAKPVSTATQTALDAKLASATAATTYAPIASPTFTGTVTVAAAGVAFTDKTQTKAGVPSLTTIGTTVSSNTTLDLLGTDAAVRDSLIPLSGAVNINFEATGNAKYSIGSSISFYQSSSTGANITGTGGITVLSTPGATLRALNSSVTATKIAATTWLLAGDLKA
jgi:hypothetical protein